MITHPRRWRRSGAADEDARGSVLIWVAGIAPVIFLLFMLVVDGGRKVKAEEQAQNYAAEAARTAVLAASGPHQVEARMQASLAIAAVNSYLASAGIHGTAKIVGPGAVQVTATVRLQGPVSGATFTESATATAHLLLGDRKGEAP